jgi:hypothetical protein
VLEGPDIEKLPLEDVRFIPNKRLLIVMKVPGLKDAGNLQATPGPAAPPSGCISNINSTGIFGIVG